jgi:hypothetical protein
MARGVKEPSELRYKQTAGRFWTNRRTQARTGGFDFDEEGISRRAILRPALRETCRLLARLIAQGGARNTLADTGLSIFDDSPKQF